MSSCSPSGTKPFTPLGCRIHISPMSAARCEPAIPSSNTKTDLATHARLTATRCIRPLQHNYCLLTVVSATTPKSHFAQTASQSQPPTVRTCRLLSLNSASQSLSKRHSAASQTKQGLPELAAQNLFPLVRDSHHRLHAKQTGTGARSRDSCADRRQLRHR